jgi:tripartite-type tricarboxylate transporter receptor subunit TctC
VAIAIVLLLPVQGLAQSKFVAADYFKSKTIQIIIPSVAGSGADVRTRIFADVAAKKYFPGSPRIIIKNMVGAGGSVGVQRGLDSKPDGLTIFRVDQRFLLREVLGQPFGKFDSTQLVILGSDNNSQPRIWYVRSTVAKSWADVEQASKPVLEGANSPEATGSHMAALLGYPINIVYGYGGSAQIRAAFDRGEIASTDLLGPQMTTVNPKLVQEHAFAPIFWWGKDPNTDQQTLDYLKQLGAAPPPYVLDVLKKATPDQKEVFTVGSSFPTSVTFLPHGVSPDVVAVWKDVLTKTYQDPEVQQRSLAAGTSVEWIPAEGITSLMDEARALVKNKANADLLLQLVGTL